MKTQNGQNCPKRNCKRYGFAVAALVALLPFSSIAQSVAVTETDGDQSKLLSPEPNINFSTGNTSSYVITVDPTTTYQSFDGVGAALTDSSAWLIATALTPTQQAAVMQELFSPGAGAGIGALRIPMGASDFTVNGNYSYDDVPTGEADPELANFSIAHDQAYIIPTIQGALSQNPNLKIFALPWSPPAWMKTSGTMNGGTINSSDFGPLADYFVKFIQAYQANGIPIYAVSPQNEPLNNQNGYPSALLLPTDEASLITGNLVPALTSAGLSPRILSWELNWDVVAYPDTVLALAGSEVAGSAFHCYDGVPEVQSTVEVLFPSEGIWETECTGSVGSAFSSDLVWNADMLVVRNIRNWGKSVVLWNLALNQNSGPTNGGCQNCRGVLTIDTSTSPATITPNVEYYILGQIGKFVAPGALRINSNTFGGPPLLFTLPLPPILPTAIEDVAFRNPDGSIVLFVLNNSSSSSNTFTVSWSGANFNYTLPPSSVVTFKWPAS